MKILRDTLNTLGGEHPSLRLALSSAHPLSRSERDLIDGMLERALGNADPDASQTSEAGHTAPWRWFVRERTLIIVLDDPGQFAVARFLARELAKMLCDLGFPGGAQDVRFRTAGYGRRQPSVASPTDSRAVSPQNRDAKPQAFHQRPHSAGGARALREAASQQSDSRLAAALARLARHVDPEP